MEEGGDEVKVKVEVEDMEEEDMEDMGDIEMDTMVVMIIGITHTTMIIHIGTI